MRKMNDGTAEVSNDFGGCNASDNANAATGLSDSQDDEAEGRNKNNETRAVATTEQLLQREESPNEDHNDTEGLARDIALQVANDFEKLRACSLMLAS